jgi:hypothetical protein
MTRGQIHIPCGAFSILTSTNPYDILSLIGHVTDHVIGHSVGYIGQAVIWVS